MKKMIINTLFLCLSIFSQGEKVNESKYEKLYLQAINLYLNNLKSIETDTIIIQKEDYLPQKLPYKINNHVIILLTKKEIDEYDGIDISMRFIKPVEKNKDLFVIGFMYLGYTQKHKKWVFSGGVYYRFKYDIEHHKYTFIEKSDFGI